MTLKEYRNHFTTILTPLYDEDEVIRFFYIVLEAFKGWSRVDFVLNADAVLTEEETLQWDAVVKQLEVYKPIQYIIGYTFFYGLRFDVNENTLIPRPETEELADWIIADVLSNDVAILDIGTGSGCIAISLAKNIKNAKVSAIDVSEGALEVAKTNAINNAVEVNFIKQNMLALDALPQKYDVIVSNPPYVRNLEKQEIKPNVLDFEPHLALFVEDNDPLIFYRKITQLAKAALTPGGKLYFEINQYLGPETVAMMQEEGFKNIELRKDMFGNDRMIKAGL